jgi:two-component system cell cycle sensor histidine kinase/response regulator CckA
MARTKQGICRVDQDGRIIAADPALVSMLGYQSQQEMVGLNVATDMGRVWTEGNARNLRTALEGSSTSCETQWARKDGTSITVRLTSHRLVHAPPHAGASAFEIIVEDITARPATATSFHLDLKIDDVGRLAREAAHDLNNLLMTIDSYAHLLEDSSDDSERVVEYAKKIHDASSRAASVTRRLGALKRKPTREPKVLDLNHTVTELAKTLPRMLRANVVVHMGLDPHLGKVRADRSQVEKIIMSLLVHASDSMPRGGRITIETSNVQVDAENPVQEESHILPESYAMLAVLPERDTCADADGGIESHGVKSSYTSKESKREASLALRLVSQLVRHNHGYVRFHEANEGKVFRVYLPVFDVSGPDRHPETTESSLKGSETILLVEDEASLREVTGTYLKSKGYIMLEASNSADALTICKSYEGPIHVLLTDIVMPGSGGYELAIAARELRAGLKVVLISGYPDNTGEEQAARVNGTFLHKPFTLDVLARKIRSAIDHGCDLAEAG